MELAVFQSEVAKVRKSLEEEYQSQLSSQSSQSDTNKIEELNKVIHYSVCASLCQLVRRVHFLQLKPFTQYQFSLYLVPITAGWTEAVWIQCLAKGFTHDQQESNPTVPFHLSF